MRGQGESVADEQKQHYFQPGDILVAPGHTYLVLGLLGEGGMGRVYEAIDRDTGNEVAIKVLHDEHAHGGNIQDRFGWESRIPGQVVKRIKTHPTRGAAKYLLKVTAIGELQPHGAPYYAMTRLSGCTVQAQIQGARLRAQRCGLKPGLPVDTALNIAIGLLLSLVALHQCGVVHRDVKPANIFLHKAPGEADAVVLLDYGIAHLMDEGSRTGVAGSTGYIAPEHFRGEIGPPADIFAVGVLLYLMLAGERPTIGLKSAWPEPGETRVAPSLAPFGVVPALVDLIARCLALDPSERPTAVELSAQLQEISNALEPIDVGTAVTEDDLNPIDRSLGERSTGISIAECSPATSPDLGVTARMSALRAKNERRAALGLQPLTHLPNNETTPMMDRPILPMPGGLVVLTTGRRQQTVPMGRAHLVPILRSPPEPEVDLMTLPPTSSPSPMAFGPVSQPEYDPESVSSARPIPGPDSILARLPDRAGLAEALKRAVQARHSEGSGKHPSSPASATIVDGPLVAPSSRGSNPPVHASTMAGLARTPHAEPRRYERFLVSLRELRSAIAAALAARRERAVILAREKSTAHAARMEAQRLTKELAAKERSESELANKQHQVAENRRLRREAEARGESWTEKSEPRHFIRRFPLAFCALALGTGFVGMSAGRFIMRRNAMLAATAPSLAPTSAVSGSDGAAELAAAPAAPSSLLAAPAASVRVASPRARTQASAARVPAAAASLKGVSSSTSTNSRPPQRDFE